MKDNDYIKELFSEKLSNHEVPVRSDLWSGIQSQIGNTATTAAAAKGISVATKWAIGIASSVVVAGSVAWFASSDGANPPKVKEQLSHAEAMKPASTPETEGQEAAVGFSGPAAATGPEDTHKADGTATMQQEKIAVKDAGASAPLILKQRVDETTSNAGVSTPADNKGVSTPSGKGSSAGYSSSTPGETAQGTKPVVGKIKWVNVFTPNNDRDNDVLELENSNLKDFSITVFNEKMQPVFSSSDPNFTWDGTYNQEPLPAGNYGYMVIATDNNGNLIKEFRNLTIRK